MGVEIAKEIEQFFIGDRVTLPEHGGAYEEGPYPVRAVFESDTCRCDVFKFDAAICGPHQCITIATQMGDIVAPSTILSRM